MRDYFTITDIGCYASGNLSHCRYVLGAILYNTYNGHSLWKNDVDDIVSRLLDENITPSQWEEHRAVDFLNAWCDENIRWIFYGEGGLHLVPFDVY